MHPFRSRPLRRAALGLVTALAVCAAVPEAGGAQINALLGTWTLVPERSMATPGPLRYRSLTLTFSATEHGLKNKATGIDARGQPIDSTFLIVEDGKYHPVTGATRFDSSSYTRLGDRNTVYVRRKHRDTVVVGSRSLSSDGQTLMFREKTVDDLGREVGRALLVFEKQKGRPDASRRELVTPVTDALRPRHYGVTRDGDDGSPTAFLPGGPKG